MGGLKSSVLTIRFIKKCLIALAIVVVLVFIAQLWMERIVKEKLETLVDEKSEGRMRLTLGSVNLNLFKARMQVKGGSLADIDTTSSPITYKVSFSDLSVKVRSIWPLIFGNVLIDSIKINNPVAHVVQWKTDTTNASVGQDLSISQEMGKMYNSMLDALEEYGIRRIGIDNASFNFVNKTQPQSPPTIIDKVYFDLVRTAPGRNDRGEFVEGEQSVELRTTNQHIKLPGNKHELVFSSFNLELFNQRIVLDSCTIIAKATDESENSYTIFFKKLILAGVDFDAMYSQDIIRADSVYCDDPIVYLKLDSPGNNEGSSNEKPEDVIRELAGRLDLKYVGVKNAGLHIDIAGTSPRTIFNSNSDNIDIRGLRVNVDADNPLSVESFEMMMKNYRMLNEDSSVAYGFQSLRFQDNKIALNNFFIDTDSKGKRQQSIKNISIPTFELTGINWSKLAFENKLEAQEALLVNPEIKYVNVQPAQKRKRSNVFSSLEDIDELISLQRLRIVNGKVDITTNPTTAFKFNDLHIDIQTNQLLRAANSTAIVRSVNVLAFSYGSLRLQDVHAQVSHAQLTGDNSIAIRKIVISSPTNKMKGTIDQLVLDNLRYALD
jgi:hypothetical protein